MMATFFGLNLVFNATPASWMDCGLLFIFYGLYYGVLGRDISEICADKMASHVGVFLSLNPEIINFELSFSVLYKSRDADPEFGP